MGKRSSIARAALITLSQLLFQSSPDQRQAVQAEMISMNGVLLLSNILCPAIASTAKAASSKSCETHMTVVSLTLLLSLLVTEVFDNNRVHCCHACLQQLCLQLRASG